MDQLKSQLKEADEKNLDKKQSDQVHIYINICMHGQRFVWEFFLGVCVLCV